jgi:hypothetical protein
MSILFEVFLRDGADGLFAFLHDIGDKGPLRALPFSSALISSSWGRSVLEVEAVEAAMEAAMISNGTSCRGDQIKSKLSCSSRRENKAGPDVLGMAGLADL